MIRAYAIVHIRVVIRFNDGRARPLPGERASVARANSRRYPLTPGNTPWPSMAPGVGFVAHTRCRSRAAREPPKFANSTKQG